jgi:4-carboxymuconolactone decarboxylase
VFESPLAQAEANPVELDDPPQSENRSVRRKRGLAALAATSSTSGEAVVRSFDDIAPEIGGMILEHSYGDIFHRPGLDPKTRKLTACAALAARGLVSTESPLRVHINAALTTDASEAEVVETLLNMLPYSGYPASSRRCGSRPREFTKRSVIA